MRLSPSSRLGLALVGVLLVSGAGVGAAFNWSATVLLAFVGAAVFMLFGAITGVAPGGSFKEGSIEWPKLDEQPRVDKLKSEVATLRSELAEARKETRRLTKLLDSHIIDHEWVADYGARRRMGRVTRWPSAASLISVSGPRRSQKRRGLPHCDDGPLGPADPMFSLMTGRDTRFSASR